MFSYKLFLLFNDSSTKKSYEVIKFNEKNLNNKTEMWLTENELIDTNLVYSTGSKNIYIKNCGNIT